MEARKEKNAPWLSVPQFGDWDQKGQVPDYSLDFSKIRETRKQNKTNISRASLGNEEEFINTTATSMNNGHTHTDEHQHQHPHYDQNSHSPTYIISTQAMSCVQQNCTTNAHHTPYHHQMW